MAVDMYLKIEGIPGESTDAKHDKWIQISSYTHGIQQEVAGAGGSGQGGHGGGLIDFETLKIVKIIDVSTPDLHLFCCDGKHIEKVELECCLAAGEKHTFMKYELEDVYINSVMANGDASGVRPSEVVSFAFGKIKWEYTPIDQKGKPGTAIDRIWDLEKNEQG